MVEDPRKSKQSKVSTRLNSRGKTKQSRTVSRENDDSVNQKLDTEENLEGTDREGDYKALNKRGSEGTHT